MSNEIAGHSERLREQFETWLRKEYPGIPEGYTDDQEGDTDLAWQAYQAGHNESKSHDAFMRKRFADVVPDLCSGSWEDIWERVRDKFREGN